MKSASLIKQDSDFLERLDLLSQVNLLRISKTYQKWLALALSLPVELYEEHQPSYHATRDFLILSFIRKKQKAFSFYKALGLVKETKMATVLREKKFTPSVTDVKEWKEIISNVSAENKRDEETHRAVFQKKISSSEVVNPFQEMKDMESFLKSQGVIVCTYDSTKVPVDTDQLLNFFQTKHRKDGDDIFYFHQRLTAEYLRFCNYTSTSNMMSFLMKPEKHPTYACLRFYKQIEPLESFGAGFFVFTPELLKLSLANYRNSLTEQTQDRELQMVSVSKAPTALFAQLSDDFINALLQRDKTRSYFPSTFSMKWDNEKTTFIEIQMPTGISLRDPTVLKHQHIPFEDAVRDMKGLTEQIQRGISVSVDSNPFHQDEFIAAFRSGQLPSFLKIKIVNYVKKLAQLMYEIEDQHMVCEYNPHQLIFDIKVTPDGCHQAQFAGFAYLLGVTSYFKSGRAALDFSPEGEWIRHVTPLTGIKKQNGDLTDHHAIQDTPASLSTLLNIFIKRLFQILLVSKQNEDYFEKYGRVHPITGKGATHAQNQVRDLYIGRKENQPSTIEAHWIYDRVIINVNAFSPEDLKWIMEVIATFLDKKIKMKDHFILIDLPLVEIINRFSEKWICFQALNLLDDEGNIFLAARRFPNQKFHCGKSTQGGKQTDPLSEARAGMDGEFGEIKSLQQFSKKRLGISDSKTQRYRKTIYFSSNASYFNLKLDLDEFQNHTLRSYPIYQLGNLDDKALQLEAADLSLSVKSYVQLFGKATLLREVDSIWFYIDYCAKELQKELAYCGDDIDVTIAHDYKTVNFENIVYRLPAERFGEITITANADSLKKVALFLDEHKISYAVQELKSISQGMISQLIVKNCNPQKLLMLSQRIKKPPVKNLAYQSETSGDQYEWWISTRNKWAFELICEVDEISKQGNLKDWSAETKLPALLPDEIPRLVPALMCDLFGCEEKVKRIAVLFDKARIPVLRLTVEANDLKATQFLLKHINDYPSIKFELKHSFLAKTKTSEHYFELIQSLVHAGANIYIRNEESVSLLYYALAHDHYEAAHFLINFMMENPDKFVKSTYEELVKEAKTDSIGRTILHMLFTCPNLSFNQISFVINHYPDALKIKDFEGTTILHVLAGECFDFFEELFPEMIRIAPSLIDEPGQNGFTLLHYVCNQNSHEISETSIISAVQLILEHKPNLTSVCQQGFTPLETALNNSSFSDDCKLKLLKVFMLAGANVKNLDKEKYGVLLRKLEGAEQKLSSGKLAYPPSIRPMKPPVSLIQVVACKQGFFSHEFPIFLEKYRHTHPIIQKEYDKRMGLTIRRNTND